MAKQNIVHPLDAKIRENLLNLRKNGLKKGRWAGWDELYEYYTVKEGGTTYFVSPPAVGKTALTYEITVNLAEYENCKVAIFTPETGSATDVYNELLWAYMREPFFKHKDGKMSEKDVNLAIDWMSEHFYVIDPMHQDLTASSYFQAIEQLQEQYKIKIDIAVIDPITDMDIYGEGARDLALGNFLTRVRKFSSAYKIHTFVAFHTKAIGLVEGKRIDGSKVRYYPPPTMGDVAGGEMASRKGLFIIGLWRPPLDVIDVETGEPFLRNETRVEILKAKPKALGKQGVVKLYYDTYSSRYYSLGANREKIWSYPKPINIE
jgi:hypothetical protein